MAIPEQSTENIPKPETFLRENYIQLLRDCVSFWLWLPAESRQKRFVGEDCPKNGQGDTMIGIRRLDNIYYCLKQAIEEGIEGDAIEAGVWRGGAVIFMKGIIDAYGATEKCVWVADSFQGVPAPDELNYPADAGTELHDIGLLSVSKREVMDNFRKYNLLDKRVKFLEGWFKDTLYTSAIEKLCLLRLDGDLYESTYQTLDALYPRLSPGGFCLIDDYNVFPNCKEAVNDYREKYNITEPIVHIDRIGIFWRKSMA